jgi:hypothetical protein
MLYDTALERVLKILAKTAPSPHKVNEAGC